MSQPGIDPKLVEIVEIVKDRSSASVNLEEPLSEDPTHDEINLSLIDELKTAFYSRNSDEIANAVEKFRSAHRPNSALSLDRISEIYMTYANLLSEGAGPKEIQDSLIDFTSKGSWFERYTAASLSSYIHATAQQRQAALQKAQLALSIIPTKPNPHDEIYTFHAKARVIETIAQLHNLQGNSELALSASLDYLSLTQGKPPSQVDVDIINNLIYSYSLARDHEVLLYLSEQLLEIEKSESSSVAGLSEMRIAGVMNKIGRYEEGLNYAETSISKAKNPVIKRNARVNKAMALAGLGRLDEARAAAKLSEVNLNRDHILTKEARSGVLYLAFLLAQTEDSKYATQVFNRHLDTTAQKFLANNSRDTNAMLAELENSRGRQAEREAAAARETRLQALTIDRQKKLTRTLTALSIFLALGILSAILFIRYRGKIVRKLEIKTVEAASAEKLKTEFLGMISHELRTPLNGIIGISDFLANYHDDPDIRQKTGIILHSGNELLSVVESLTDMARLDAGQLEILPHDADLSASLAVVPTPWAGEAKKKGLAFTHFLDPKITEHHIDEDRLVQCLNILLSNAVSFTDTGRVHLHITANEDGLGGVTGLTAIVADTGQGMSELVQSRLFKPFMQADTSRKRSHMGTGLSLAIAYALAEMMGGRLTVNSREDRGSEFKLDIPLAPPEQTLIQASLPQKTLSDGNKLQEAEAREVTPQEVAAKLGPPVLDTPQGPQHKVIDLMQLPGGMPSLHEVEELVLPTPAEGRKRILVVDDMSSNRDVLRLVLETQGHRCAEASDGLTALAAIDRQAFDLVVLDIHMTPMDGVEMLRRLRRSGKPYANIPVIALTADNAASTNAACMEAGADLFLTKPVNRDELLRAIGYLNETEGARILSQ